MSDDLHADVLALFGGAGGMAEGARRLGLTEFGIDWNAAVCGTRQRAGHHAMHADLATLRPAELDLVVAPGLHASPSCRDWSGAGLKTRRSGESGYLVDVVPGWVKHRRPTWVTCEQVPEALEVWREHARVYEQLGYSVWCGVLNAADYGVPQTRRRAILIARLDGQAAPPTPTHSEHGHGMLGELPWITMADVLDRDPSWVLDRRQQKNGRAMPTISMDRPAPTLTAMAGAKSVWVWRWEGPEPPEGASDRFTLDEARVIQTFPAGYPFDGTRFEQFQQVGDAVPPLLAAHIVAEATGRTLDGR
jgi:DNA (cytosine-5)-methyltransferase 1